MFLEHCSTKFCRLNKKNKILQYWIFWKFSHSGRMCTILPHQYYSIIPWRSVTLVWMISIQYPVQPDLYYRNLLQNALNEQNEKCHQNKTDTAKKYNWKTVPTQRVTCLPFDVGGWDRETYLMFVQNKQINWSSANIFYLMAPSQNQNLISSIISTLLFLLHDNELTRKWKPLSQPMMVYL